MSEATLKGLGVVKWEEENNATAKSNEADAAAPSGNYKEANKAADKSEEHSTNATNIGIATGTGWYELLTNIHAYRRTRRDKCKILGQDWFEVLPACFLLQEGQVQ